MKKSRIIPSFEKFELVLKSVPLNQINDYRNFWRLIKNNPKLNLVPTKSIDEVWHIHLKNEYLYLDDCNRYFGYVLNHVETINSKKQTNNFLVTKKLWEALYNSPYGEISDMAFCGVQGDGGGVETGETK